MEAAAATQFSPGPPPVAEPPNPGGGGIPAADSTPPNLGHRSAGDPIRTGSQRLHPGLSPLAPLGPALRRSRPFMKKLNDALRRHPRTANRPHPRPLRALLRVLRAEIFSISEAGARCLVVLKVSQFNRPCRASACGSREQCCPVKRPRPRSSPTLACWNYCETFRNRLLKKFCGRAGRDCAAGEGETTAAMRLGRNYTGSSCNQMP